jgi:LPPG:FO 2-phospho-L-lactate transferase
MWGEQNMPRRWETGAVRVTLLGGGVGCSRLAVPLAEALGAGELTLVVNTGDDLWRHGLRVCPDLDTNLYALSGLRDRGRGWGVAGDTFRTMEQLRLLGEDAWFNLGDLDLATHLLRTGMLREGATLSEVTAGLTAALGVGVTLLPASDDEIATRVVTPAGELSFQEYFVQHRAQAEVVEVRYRGADDAGPAPGVLSAIEGADLVVLGPSNPVSSLGPILAVPGIRDALEGRRRAGGTTVAVTPVVNGVPIEAEGEAHRARCRAAMMAARGFEHRSSAVGEILSGLAEVFVLDRADAGEAPELAAQGYRVVESGTIISNPTTGSALVEVLLSLVPFTPRRDQRDLG